ncbi:MAG: amidohydrolase family protein [Sedimentisphaerales bacterium]|nr:amidohydrolase family protein [Sedimentisphaerales bacterium]
MIIDSHSHIWPNPECLGRAEQLSCLTIPRVERAHADAHQASMHPASISIVLGFASRLLAAEIPNAYIAKYRRENPRHIVGFAGIDPTERQAAEQLEQLHTEEGFLGFTLSPACQGIHPCDTRAMRLYERAQELQMPVYFLCGMTLPEAACLEYAQPLALDEVARSFPRLKIILSHLGFPWVEQLISLLAKHPNVYADVAGLSLRPWLAYRSLTLAYECGVIEKLFFASDFPVDTVKNAVESLYNLNKITLDSVLPAVPREQLRGIVERDTLEILELSHHVKPAKPTVGEPTSVSNKPSART